MKAAGGKAPAGKVPGAKSDPEKKVRREPFYHIYMYFR